MNKLMRTILILVLGLIILGIISTVLTILRKLLPLFLLAAIAYGVYSYVQNKNSGK